MKSHPPHSKANAIRGLTLIELMLAMAVLSMLLLSVLSILRANSREFREVRERLAMEREARAVVAQLREDLAVAALEAPIAATWTGPAPAWCSLRCAGMQQPHRWLGDLTAVRYALGDLECGASAGGAVRCLVRSVRDSAEVYQVLRDEVPGALWQEPDAVAEPLAMGVLDFQTRAVVNDGLGRWSVWEGQTAAPDALEVRLVLASPRLIARLRTADQWDEALRGMADLGARETLCWHARLPVRGENQGAP